MVVIALLGCGAACSSDDSADDPMPSAGSAGTGAGTGGGGAGASGGGGAGAGTGGEAGTAAEAGTGGSGDLSTLSGSFVVKLVSEREATLTSPASIALTTVLGKVKDGEDPVTTKWDPTDMAGDCTLLVPKVPFCDPTCTGGEVCVDDGVCAAYPTAQNVGDVAVTGLGDDFTMKLIAGNYQSPTLAYPPCEEGQPIELQTTGGDYAAFQLQGACIAPLEFSGPVAIESGQPLNLTWTAPGDSSIARVEVKLDISHHGGAFGKIECDAPDTGSLEIAATLVDQLVDLGVAGFPTVLVTRVARNSADGASGVNLVLSASEEELVEIPGLMSCTDDAHCPGGQTCGSDLKCQ